MPGMALTQSGEVPRQQTQFVEINGCHNPAAWPIVAGAKGAKAAATNGNGLSADFGLKHKPSMRASNSSSQLTALLGGAHTKKKNDSAPTPAAAVSAAVTPAVAEAAPAAAAAAGKAARGAALIGQALEALDVGSAGAAGAEAIKPDDAQLQHKACGVPPPALSSPSTTKEQALVARAQRELQRESAVCEQTQQPEGATYRVGLNDFDILRVVGQGAFGKVFQVRHTGQKQVYAMKVMRKDRIIEKDHFEYVRAERDVLTAIVHPYIVTLRFSFQTPSKLYLVLDFINGGHLFFQLYRQGVFDEDVARLYTAEIVCAISYLHSRGIAHRDLKPENVLLDSDGHIKLTDFGLAKPNMNCDTARTNSFIGTMEYMAPEIIDGTGHGKGVDWWSIGILLYEMLCGVPPFRAKSRNQLQQQIVNAKPKFPKFLSSNALSLLKGLLTRDVNKRLGTAGCDGVKKHAFFKKIDWSKLERREVESKFKPSVKNSFSIENFDKIWTDQPAEDSPCGTPTNPKFANVFEGFSYVSPSMLAQAMAQMDKKCDALAGAVPGAAIAVTDAAT